MKLCHQWDLAERFVLEVSFASMASHPRPALQHGMSNLPTKGLHLSCPTLLPSRYRPENLHSCPADTIWRHVCPSSPAPPVLRMAHAAFALLSLSVRLSCIRVPSAPQLGPASCWCLTWPTEPANRSSPGRQQRELRVSQGHTDQVTEKKHSRWHVLQLQSNTLAPSFAAWPSSYPMT